MILVWTNDAFKEGNFQLRQIRHSRREEAFKEGTCI